MIPDNQSPYSQNTNQYPRYRQPSNRPIFETMSLIFGIVSLLTICTGFLPLPIGALGILFAILASRKGKKMVPMAVVGTTLSGIGMGLSIFMIIISIIMLPTMMKDPQYREYMNNMSMELYGESFDDMMEESYGIDIDDYLANH